MQERKRGYGDDGVGGMNLRCRSGMNSIVGKIIAQSVRSSMSPLRPAGSSESRTVQ